MNSALYLPLELLDQIISWAFTLHSARDDALHVPSKPPWDAVWGFSLASKTSREIFLGYWFTTLFMTERKHIDEAAMMFPEIFSHWTRLAMLISFFIDGLLLRRNPSCRHLHFVQLAVLEQHTKHNPSFTEKIQKLLTIRFDDGLHLHSRNSLEHHLQLLSNPRVKSFSIYDASWPYPYTMTLVSTSFIGLRYLAIRSSAIWCGLCYTCSIPAFASPIPPNLRYENSQGLGLPVRPIISNRCTLLNDMPRRLFSQKP